MIPDNLYKLGKKLGLTHTDIDNILSSESKKQYNVRHTSPIEVYKGVIKYGTISIKDF